jgi:hypothetical protein
MVHVRPSIGMGEQKQMARKKTTNGDSKLGMMVAVGGALAATGFILAKTLAGARAGTGEGHSAAFARKETDEENYDQTRHAGTAAMRDEPQKWDEIDEQLDASFPSSDPPSFNPGIA